MFLRLCCLCTTHATQASHDARPMNPIMISFCFRIWSGVTFKMNLVHETVHRNIHPASEPTLYTESASRVFLGSPVMFCRKRSRCGGCRAIRKRRGEVFFLPHRAWRRSRMPGPCCRPFLRRDCVPAAGTAW